MVATTLKHSIEYTSLSEIDKVAEELISFAGEEKIWAFEGEMGAGKTTLIKAICERLAVVDHVSSPTFSIVNEYQTEQGEVIFHFDFYRLKNESEALDIGVEEYFFSGDLCLLEWPSKISNLLPDNYLTVKINIENTNRIVELFKNRPAS